MKRILAAILTIVMLAMLCGCGNAAKKLTGTWQTEADLSQQVSQLMLGEVGDMSEYFDFSGFTIQFLLTLSADGTYNLRPEQASVQAAFDALLVNLKDGLVRFYEDEIAHAGLGMTVEEYLATQNVTMDDLIETLEEHIAQEDLVSNLVEANTREGQFSATDGKLYLSAGAQFGIDETVYETYTLEGNTLTLTSHVDGDETDTAGYPRVFQKVS